MKLILNKRGKFEVEMVLTFDELNYQVPLVAQLAYYDLGPGNRATEFTYVVRDSDLYAWRKQPSSEIIQWYFFDNSTRRWSECDNP